MMFLNKKWNDIFPLIGVHDIFCGHFCIDQYLHLYWLVFVFIFIFIYIDISHYYGEWNLIFFFRPYENIHRKIQRLLKVYFGTMNGLKCLFTSVLIFPLQSCVNYKYVNWIKKVHYSKSFCNCSDFLCVPFILMRFCRFYIRRVRFLAIKFHNIVIIDFLTFSFC